MTSRIRTTLREAMTQLRKGNVLAATSVIQRSLRIGPAANQSAPAKSKSKMIDLQVLARRPMDGTASADRVDQAVLDRSRPINVPPTPDAPEKPTALERAVGFGSRTFRSNAGSVSYKLYVPNNASTQDLALVLMLHGCTQSPDDFARGTDMNKLADEFGFIVAYPHQHRTANPQGCWNWFDDRHQHRGSGEPVLLSGLAQELAREFRISGNRIFAAGLSAGGAMADILASTYPEVFAAVGIHSGLPSGAATTMMSALVAMKGSRSGRPQAETATHPFVRKIIFHGDADSTVNAKNGEQIFDRSRSQRSDAAEITSDTTIDGRKVTRTSLEGRDGVPLLEHWVIHGAGHAWVGGEPGGSYVDPVGPNASREMVRFFLHL